MPSSIVPATGRRPAMFGAVLVGLATGLRSQMGLASLVVRPGPGLRVAWLRRPAVRRIALAAAAGELVVDKLPSAPDRTEALGLVARLGLGGLAGGLLGSGRGARGPVLPAATGALAALGGAYGGLALRSRLARRLPPLAVACSEDLVAVGLGWAARHVTSGPA